MSTKTYHIIITIAFSVLSLLTIVGVITQKPVLANYIDRQFLMLLLIFFICISESYFIERIIFKVIGIFFTLIWFIGILKSIMHFSYGKELIAIGASVVTVHIFIHRYWNKKANLINWLLFLFIFSKTFATALLPREFLWWLDAINCLAIALLGAKCIISDRNMNV